MDTVSKLLKIIETPPWFHGVRLIERDGDEHIILITNKKVDKKTLDSVPEYIDDVEVIIVYKEYVG